MSNIDLANLDGTDGFRLSGYDLDELSGYSVSRAGDVNGDGFDDLIIGNRALYQYGSDNRPAAYVVFGQASGFAANASLASLDGADGFRIDGDVHPFLRGNSVSAAGDINGDGFADLIVGDPDDFSIYQGTYAGFVIFGKATGFTAVVEASALDGADGFVLVEGQSADLGGASVSDAGDINGDGFADLIIGAPEKIDGAVVAGESYVIFGDGGGFSASTNLGALDGVNGFRLIGASPEGRFGRTVSGAGDVNGDGIDDIIIGDPLAQISFEGTDFSGNPTTITRVVGEAYVVFGQASGFGSVFDTTTLDGSDGFSVAGATINKQHGNVVSAAGDINGDGFADVIMTHKTGGGQREEYVVVFGKASGFDVNYGGPLSGEYGQAGDIFMDISGQGIQTVSGAGDINGDGIDDLVFGAPTLSAASETRDYGGASFVVFGSTGFSNSTTIDIADLDGTDGFRIEGSQENDYSGGSVSGAGDIDGDGFDDLIIGSQAERSVSGFIDYAGASFVVFGSDSGAVTHQGTAASETLTGDANANVIIGGRGDDTLVGAGGLDVLRGGAGDDILDVADLGFQRLVGGTGIDTLRLSGASLNLDFTAAGSQLVESIEAIDLAGVGAGVTLDALSVLRLSEVSNSLIITGGADDSVSFGDSGWTLTAQDAGTVTIEKGPAKLVIDRDIVLTGAGAPDLTTPTLLISLDDTILRAGETTTATFTFSEAVTGFDNGDIAVPNGTLSTVTSADGGVTFTGVFTPTVGIDDPTNIISVGTGYIDGEGKSGAAADSPNFIIDQTAPSVAITLDDNALAAGQAALVAFTFSEAVTGFDNGDITAPNGTLSTVSSSDGGVTFTATFTPTVGVDDPSNVISVGAGYADLAGNAGPSADSANFTIDHTPPTATVTLDDAALILGETAAVTITFTEAVTNFSNADISVSNGSLSTLASSDGGVTFTGVFTPSAGVEDPTNIISIGADYADIAGNAGASADSANFAIDTLAPTVTITLDDAALIAGDTATATFTFSEAVTGFDNADITVPNGALSAVASSDGGVTFTGTFTPTADIEDPTNVLSVGVGYADGAGNAGVAADSGNFAIDTLTPTVAIVLDDTNLAVGETATATFTFSEAVTGFDNSDITVPNGALSAVASSDGGVTFTGVFTPTVGVNDTTNVIGVGAGYADVAGNAGTAGDSANFIIDSTPPTVTITLDDSAIVIGDKPIITFSFSEAITGFDNADITIPNGALSTVTSADGGVTFKGIFTPNANVDDATNIFSVSAGFADFAGNAGAAADSANFTIDTIPVSVINLADLDGANGFRLDGAAQNDKSGKAVSFAGDVNGDGFADLIIGAYKASTSDGESYVVFGKAAGFAAGINLAELDGADGFRVTGNNDAEVGYSVSSAGDINGDGFADVLIGAPRADFFGPTFVSNPNAGDSFVVFGKASSFDPSIAVTTLDGANGFSIPGIDSSDASGYSVSGAGDVNGDGLSDFIVGAVGGRPGGNAYAGESYVVFGQTGAFSPSLNLAALDGSNGFRLDGIDASDRAGAAVSSAGDFNGDGFADVIIGARGGDPNGTTYGLVYAGEAYVVFGQAGGFAADQSLASLDGTNGFRLEGFDQQDFLGAAVSSAGDINGDGFADLIIGAFGADPNGDDFAGESYVVFGKASGVGSVLDLATLDGTNGFRADGADDGDVSGRAISSAGDVNGDGFDDLIIGAGGADPSGGSAAGESYVIFGKASGFASAIDLGTLDGTDGFLIGGVSINDLSGYAVSGGGDVNGDGFDDLIIGARLGDPSGGRYDAGESYVVFGFDSGASTHRGTAANETLTGDASANVMIGGLGDDTLIGAGGLDVLRGGGGDDILDVADLGFQRIVGGTGTDTLRISGAGLSLDFTAVGSQLVESIEAIDLAGAGTGLTLDAVSVVGLSEASNTLTITGDASDTLTLTDAGWTHVAVSNGQHTLTNGLATILVDVTVQQAGAGAPALPPTVTITLDDTDLRDGETALVTFAFSGAVTGFDNSDITVPNGTLSTVTSADGDVTFTATFTPTAGIEDATNIISVGAGYASVAGPAGTAADSANFTIDTLPPTVAVTLDDSALIAGETAAVTFTFSEAVADFDNSDVTAPNGALSAVSTSDGGITFAATFTPDADVEGADNVISVGAGYADLAGNAGAAADSANFAIDTALPTVAITLDDVSLTVGETAGVTFTFSEAVTGFDNADIVAPNGTLSTVASVDGGLTFAGTFTPTAGVEDATNVFSVGTGFEDSAGNAGVAADSGNFVIDQVAPTVVVALDDASLIAGETATVTFTFSEAVAGIDNTDVTIPNGALSAVASSDGGLTFTATFTPDADVEDADNVISVGTGYADLAGNLGGAGDSANFAIDTATPTATVALDDTTLLAGETTTVTFTFSEAVSGFDNTDVAVPNGTLTAVSSADGGATFTATFTPDAGIEDTTNVISIGAAYADLAGNPGAAAQSANFVIDGITPTLTIALDDSELFAGETAGVTFTFSEAVTGFDNTDITVPNGSLTTVASSDGGVTFTAVFTPAAGVNAGTNVISVGASYTDSVGNIGAQADSADFLISAATQIIGDENANLLTGTDNIDGILGLGGDDTLKGRAGDDVMRGGDNNDLIIMSGGDEQAFGDGGDDEIRILAGDMSAGDRFDGGAGTNDLLTVINGATIDFRALALFTGIERVAVGAGSIVTGTDADLAWFGSTGDEVFNLGAGVDQVDAGGGADVINGGGGADILKGQDGDDQLNGEAGDDTLIGGNGADVINGGLGADTMIGGLGGDTYTVDNAGDEVLETVSEPGAIDTINSSITLRMPFRIEVLNLIGGNLNATAPTSGATINGTSGNNVLNGHVRDDVLNGGAGADRLRGSGGDDILSGGDDNDLLVGDDGNDQLFGGNGVDILAGGNGSDILDGGAGADVLIGGPGNDTYVIDDPSDRINERNSGTAGFDTVQSSIDFALSVGLEKLELTGNANLRGTGTSLGEQLIGNAGENILLGGGGNDLLNGGDGDDRLFGHSGRDTIVGGDGDDVISSGGNSGNGAESVNGGAGFDLIYLTADFGADTIVFAPGMDRDVIFQFEDGLDQMRVSDFNFSGFADFGSSVRDVNGSTIITFAPGDDAVLVGISANQIDASDFIF